ncbi:hypothetical protein FHR87_001697 [Azomonas macrocytogenes]|uniref:Uncharacterized protein n=1 Tax=Azomonas macrocytogenes TaxID=69962 RepID=A0A839T1M3_AZOMA|nr:hypothetical protein [Azomonas macrocytogenes]
MVDRQAWIEANISSFYSDDGHLSQIFDRCIGRPIQEDIDSQPIL